MSTIPRSEIGWAKAQHAKTPRCTGVARVPELEPTKAGRLIRQKNEKNSSGSGTRRLFCVNENAGFAHPALDGPVILLQNTFDVLRRLETRRTQSARACGLQWLR